MTSHRPKMGDAGILTVITGRQGTGKTDNSLKWAEKVIRSNPGIVVLTNIMMLDRKDIKNPHYKKDWPMIINVTSMCQLLDEILVHEKILMILDEAGVGFSSGGSGNRKDIAQMEVFIKLMRKFGVSLFWIDQRGEGSVPKTMRQLATYHIHKPHKYEVQVWDGFDQEDGGQRATQILRRKISFTDCTTIPFDTGAPGGFEIDFPEISYTDLSGKLRSRHLTIMDLFNYIKNVNSKHLRSSIREFMELYNINDHGDGGGIEREEHSVSDSVREKMTKKDAIFFLLDLWTKENDLDPEKGMKKYPATKDLANLFKSRPEAISRIKKEWREKNITSSGE